MAEKEKKRQYAREYYLKKKANASCQTGNIAGATSITPKPVKNKKLKEMSPTERRNYFSSQRRAQRAALSDTKKATIREREAERQRKVREAVKCSSNPCNTTRHRKQLHCEFKAETKEVDLNTVEYAETTDLLNPRTQERQNSIKDLLRKPPCGSHFKTEIDNFIVKEEPDIQLQYVLFEVQRKEAIEEQIRKPVQNMVQMRPYQEVSDIVLRLHSLEEINEFLQDVSAEIGLVKKKGELWIEGKDSSSFTELQEYISKKTTEILQRCKSVTSTFIEKDDTATSKQVDNNDRDVKPVVLDFTSFTKENLTLLEKVNETFSSLTLPSRETKAKSKLSKSLKEKKDSFLHKYEKENQLKLKELQENLDKKLVKFKEEILTELHSASNSMTHLQTDQETLTYDQMEILLHEIKKSLTNT